MRGASPVRGPPRQCGAACRWRRVRAPTLTRQMPVSAWTPTSSVNSVAVRLSISASRGAALCDALQQLLVARLAGGLRYRLRDGRSARVPRGRRSGCKRARRCRPTGGCSCAHSTSAGSCAPAIMWRVQRQTTPGPSLRRQDPPSRTRGRRPDMSAGAHRGCLARVPPGPLAATVHLHHPTSRV